MAGMSPVPATAALSSLLRHRSKENSKPTQVSLSIYSGYERIEVIWNTTLPLWTIVGIDKGDVGSMGYMVPVGSSECVLLPV